MCARLVCVWSCGSHWSVCEVVLVSYVDAVLTVTVMRGLLIVLDMRMLIECEGATVTEMLVWGGVVGRLFEAFFRYPTRDTHGV